MVTLLTALFILSNSFAVEARADEPIMQTIVIHIAAGYDPSLTAAFNESTGMERPISEPGAGEPPPWRARAPASVQVTVMDNAEYEEAYVNGTLVPKRGFVPHVTRLEPGEKLPDFAQVSVKLDEAGETYLLFDLSSSEERWLVVQFGSLARGVEFCENGSVRFMGPWDAFPLKADTNPLEESSEIRVSARYGIYGCLDEPWYVVGVHPALLLVIPGGIALLRRFS